jgi:hypothetical protein
MLDRLCGIGSDKYLHVICSLLLTFMTGLVADIWLVRWQAAVIGCIIAFDLGLVKEIWDKVHGGTMDGHDIIAAIVGCLLGLLVTIL